MFRNREFRIRVAKTNSPEETSPETNVFPFEDPAVMQAIAKDFVKNTAIAVGCVLLASTVLHTISEILINKSKQDDE